MSGKIVPVSRRNGVVTMFRSVLRAHDKDKTDIKNLVVNTIPTLLLVIRPLRT